MVLRRLFGGPPAMSFMITLTPEHLALLGTLLSEFLAEPRAEPRRIVHGRGRSFPGLEALCVDWFPPVLLVSVYAPFDQPADLLETIDAADVPRQVETVVLQHRDQPESPAEVLRGALPEKLVVSEAGLHFEVRPGQQQNAGLFLDTRPLRQWLRHHSQGRNVLNLFAYTCALSVAALAGGARAVTNVDISKTSIAWGERNHRLNGQPAASVHSIPYNLFTSWGRIRQFGRYDLIIVDPPTRQRRAFNAERDYGAVLRKLDKCLNSGAWLVCALNSPFLDGEFLTAQIAKYLPQASFVEALPAAPEFIEAEPGKGLKIHVYEVP